jgi:hypothetical protein
MGIWVKTTVEISDALLAEARAEADRRKTTLRALIEEGLRMVVARQRKARRKPLRVVTFGGRGLHAGVTSFASMLDRAYEGRGG